MKDGWIKVCAASVNVTVADVKANAKEIMNIMDEAAAKGVKLLVLPELCLTGYTCSDLFLQRLLLERAVDELLKIANHSIGQGMITVVGLPMSINSKLYSMAAFVYEGVILGAVPKSNIPNYSEFYELRHFSEGYNDMGDVIIGNMTVPVGTNLLFSNILFDEMVIAAEVCEDLWVPNSPSISHALNGAMIIVNPSASVETTAKESYRRNLVSMQSARLLSAYIYADAGEGESTTDVVFSGHNIISENGTILAESERFKNQMVISEIDLNKLEAERRRMNTFVSIPNAEYRTVLFEMEIKDTVLTRHYPKKPFVPDNKETLELRCEEILNLQATGLKKRLSHTKAKSAVVGISGGLDSTLALLVTVRAFDMLNKDRKDIIAVTMPCYGTTDRTYNNAVRLVNELNCTLKEIPITKGVEQHFIDINHDKSVMDVTFENVQARYRTLVLMNIANQENGLVIGTGDLSELALGWATYNGDHMSMYGVNASVPKTLVRHLVRYYADYLTDANDKLKSCLLDVLDTPVSPELLPPTDDGKISQKTEDLVGPYELHDFFLYYVLRFGYEPKKLYRLSKYVFSDEYDDETLLKWLKNFYRRFFAQQFKRSCLPDGPKVGSVAVSPRGDLRMPSDASVRIWMDELEELG
ncbi:MAG: NAD(+) synthase [Lachnospiraceae bacterium]|nr:NAD(+) synthase [Lachnospiraceae bacterium]